MLAPLLAEEYEAGRLAIDSSVHLGYLARSAAGAGMAPVCRRILRTAAQQGLALRLKDATAVMLDAASCGGQEAPQLVLEMLQAGGKALQLLTVDRVATNVSAAAIPYLARQLELGSLSVESSEQFSRLLRWAVERDPGACLSMLRTRTAQRFTLSTQDASYLLQRATWRLHVGLIKHLTETAGAVLEPDDAQSCTVNAAATNCADALELLLDLGAPLSTPLLLVVINCLSSDCLAVLMRRGPLPVDTTAMHYEDDYYLAWSCPVLQLLETHARVGSECCSGACISSC
jgi:hypothetical protein